MRKDQRGFGLIESLLVIIALSLVVFVGYYVWNSQKNADKSLDNANQINQSSKTVSNDLSTYNSKIGGFSLKYPSDWQITGGIPLDSKLNGNEPQVRIQEKSESLIRSNNFGGDFYITDSAPDDTNSPFYHQGYILKSFGNGISVWIDNKTQNGGSGAEENKCPSLQIASNGTYGFKLKNGKYLSYSGSFCWGQGMSSTLSYDDQLKSTEFTTVLTMLESIRQ